MQQVGNEGVLVVSFQARSNVQQCLNLLTQSLEESPKGGTCSPQEQPQNGWKNATKITINLQTQELNGRCKASLVEAGIANERPPKH
jgi:hypothetical protein